MASIVVVVKNEWGEIEGVVGPFTAWDEATNWSKQLTKSQRLKSAQFLPLFSPDEPYEEEDDG